MDFTLKALILCHNKSLKNDLSGHFLGKLFNKIQYEYFPKKKFEYHTIDLLDIKFEKSFNNIHTKHFIKDIWNSDFIETNKKKYDIVFMPDCGGIWYTEVLKESNDTYLHPDNAKNLEKIINKTMMLLSDNGILFLSKFFNSHKKYIQEKYKNAKLVENIDFIHKYFIFTKNQKNIQVKEEEHNHKNKIEKQMDYIYSELKKFYICKLLKDSYTNQIENVSTPIVKNILDNKYNNGSDMDAVLCLFNNLFISSAKFKENGLFHLSVHISKWVKKLTLINTKSVSGFVYLSDIISDIEVIIKIPKYTEDYNNMIREYFIGVTEINKLRYIIPTFVYTIGAFICPISQKLCHSSNEYESPQIPFVIFEKIPGDNIEKMIVDNKLSFEEYLGIFIQVLLSLEVSQREIGFCHFDFHCGNLMCRKLNKNRQYSVPIDNYLYNVNAQKFLPVIIDFGLSTVKHKNTVIGSYTFPEHGMKHYMLQGVDMFKFLVYSCNYSSGNLQAQIKTLLSFYGKDDPYQILLEGEIGIDEAISEYVKEGSYSRITTQTPLMFLNWIISNPDYKHITDKYIDKVDRNLFIPLKFSTTVETYYRMFQNPDQGRKDAIKLINQCVFTKDSSYILSKYSVLLLNGYNNTLYSEQLTKDINKINEHISKNKNNMIKNDKKMLLTYKDIKIPNIIKIRDYYSRILNIRINSKKIKHKKQEVLQLINIYFTNIKIFFDIIPYLQLLYIIKEIKSVKIYKKFILSFTKSEHYQLYIQNNIEVNRAYRWSHTLLDKIQ